MADLTLRAIKAKHGDCLLLFADSATVLIDGGAPGVYDDFLHGQLASLPPDGEEPPVIDLLMVSHEDSDHIAGVLELTGNLIDAEEDNARPLVSIRRAWHNSFADSIAKTGVANLNQAKGSAASVASAFEGFLPVDFDPHEASLVLSSVSQGRNLRRDIKALMVPLNKRFKNQLVLRENADTPWRSGVLSLDVIGPTQAEIDDLKDKWEKELPKIIDKEAAKAVRIAASQSLDKSVTNLASIVAIAEAGGKTALLTGDARADMVLDWLKATDRLDGAGKARFDIIKLGHHGSKRNATPKFFQNVHAGHYVISGDGGHGNPGPETLEMLFTARPALDYLVHLTYSPAEIKTHKTYIKKENGPRLDTVLADPARLAVLRFPAAGKDFVDIAV